MNFADGTKLGGAVGAPGGREALQRGLDPPQSWAITSPMEFNKGKRRVLPLGQGSPGCTDAWGARGWGAAPQGGTGGLWPTAG